MNLEVNVTRKGQIGSLGKEIPTFEIFKSRDGGIEIFPLKDIPFEDETSIKVLVNRKPLFERDFKESFINREMKKAVQPDRCFSAPVRFLFIFSYFYLIYLPRQKLLKIFN
jgi:hypothetical protein